MVVALSEADGGFKYIDIRNISNKNHVCIHTYRCSRAHFAKAQSIVTTRFLAECFFHRPTAGFNAVSTVIANFALLRLYTHILY